MDGFATGNRRGKHSGSAFSRRSGIALRADYLDGLTPTLLASCAVIVPAQYGSWTTVSQTDKRLLNPAIQTASRRSSKQNSADYAAVDARVSVRHCRRLLVQHRISGVHRRNGVTHRTKRNAEQSSHHSLN